MGAWGVKALESDDGKLDYDTEKSVWEQVTDFTASKRAFAFLLRQLIDIKRGTGRRRRPGERGALEGRGQRRNRPGVVGTFRPAA